MPAWPRLSCGYLCAAFSALQFLLSQEERKPHPPDGITEIHVSGAERVEAELQFLQMGDASPGISPLHCHVADGSEYTDPSRALFLSGLPSFVCSKCWGGQFAKAEFSAGFLCLVGCSFCFLLQHRVLVEYHFYSKIWVQFEFLLILIGIWVFKSLLFGCFSIAWVFTWFFYLKESSVLQKIFLTFTNGLEYFRIFSVMWPLE